MYSEGLKDNFIFVHIPKTGGGSIKNHLIYANNDNRKSLKYPTKTKKGKLKKIYHGFLSHYTDEKLVSQNLINDFDSYYKFTSIRNPWERMVSLYHFRIQGADNNKDKNTLNSKLVQKRVYDSKDPVGKPITLNSNISFAEWISNHSKYLDHEENTCYLDYFDVKKMNKLIRYENLSQDFSEVCSDLNLKKDNLLHIHASKHKKYQDYYNNELKDVVYNLFKKDIIYFNYDFEMEV